MVARTRSATNTLRTTSKSPTKRASGSRSGKAPTKRKLFGAAAGERQARAADDQRLATAQAPSPEPPQMGRQSSVSSAMTQVEVEPSGPSTPERQQAGSRKATAEEAAALYQSLEAPLVYALQSWRQQLIKLQPLVKLGDHVLLGALAVLRELAVARPDLAPALHTSAPHLYTYLAAALWTVAKLCGVRTQIPNRSLMSQATHVNPQALTDFELDLLFSLGWDVAAVLRRHKLLC